MSFIHVAQSEIAFRIVYCGPSMSGKTTNLSCIYRTIPNDVMTVRRTCSDLGLEGKAVSLGVTSQGLAVTECLRSSIHKVTASI